MLRDLDPEQRPEAVRLSAQGLHDDEIAARLHCSREAIMQWRKRFYGQCLAGLDRPRPLARPTGVR